MKYLNLQEMDIELTAIVDEIATTQSEVVIYYPQWFARRSYCSFFDGFCTYKTLSTARNANHNCL